MASLKLNLYENGIDSIKHAIEHYASDPDETRKYKYAILHLAQGIVLLLKERLRREHPNFVFRKVETDVNDPGSFTTVNVTEVLQRLKKIAHVELGRGEEIVTELVNLRNAIEHYELHITKNEADVIIGRSVPFIASFMEYELNQSLEWAIGRETWETLWSIQGYYATAIKDAVAYLQKNKSETYLCSQCNALIAVSENKLDSDDPFKLVSSPVKCTVCRRLEFFRVRCLRCGQIYSLQHGQVPNLHSYCGPCSAYASERFGRFQIRNGLSVYASEVERWFSQHQIITTDELLKLLFNVFTAMSSAPDYPMSLYREGLIDFENDYDRAEYEATKHLPGIRGFKMHYCFIWKFSPLENQ